MQGPGSAWPQSAFSCAVAILCVLLTCLMSLRPRAAGLAADGAAEEAGLHCQAPARGCASVEKSQPGLTCGSPKRAQPDNKWTQTPRGAHEL
jgi:hypothetical protein